MCVYKDYANVPPSDEDIKLNEKKTLIKAALISRQGQQEERGVATDEFDEEVMQLLSDPIMERRGRGNRATSTASNKDHNGTIQGNSRSDASRFIGIMGTNFPARLHDLLTTADEEQDREERGGLGEEEKDSISSAISWLPHGRSWIIHDKAKFIKEVSRSHFHFSKYESFIRQVNAWGFKRVTRGADANSYYHEMFLRGMPHLVRSIKRNKALTSPRKRYDGGGKACLQSLKDPDFYTIARNNPIPDYYSRPNDITTTTTKNCPPGSVGQPGGSDSSSDEPCPQLPGRNSSSFSYLSPQHKKKPHSHNAPAHAASSKHTKQFIPVIEGASNSSYSCRASVMPSSDSSPALSSSPSATHFKADKTNKIVPANCSYNFYDSPGDRSIGAPSNYCLPTIHALPSPCPELTCPASTTAVTPSPSPVFNKSRKKEQHRYKRAHYTFAGAQGEKESVLGEDSFLLTGDGRYDDYYDEDDVVMTRKEKKLKVATSSDTAFLSCNDGDHFISTSTTASSSSPKSSTKMLLFPPAPRKEVLHDSTFSATQESYSPGGGNSSCAQRIFTAEVAKVFESNDSIKLEVSSSPYHSSSNFTNSEEAVLDQLCCEVEEQDHGKGENDDEIMLLNFLQNLFDDTY